MEQYANNATSTLDGAIDDTVTSLDVASAAAFPSSGNFRIKIDDEILLVTAVSTNTFTVTRGVESTVAAPHSNGVFVRHVLTAASLSNIVQEKGSILEAIWEAMDANTDPIDNILTIGNFRIFIYMTSHNANTWKPASNSYTVPVGKKLILMTYFLGSTLAADRTSRKGRLFNVTDATEIFSSESSDRGAFPLIWEGDLANPTQFSEAAAGKELRLEVWNTDTNKRAAGIVVIAREVDA